MQRTMVIGDVHGCLDVATGRWMLGHRAMPTHDPFCFATVQQAWTVVSVGSQVLFAAVADRFGLRALMVMATIIESFAASWLWLATSRRGALRLLLLPFALFFVQLDAEDLSARGQIFGDVGVIWLLLTMQHLRQGRSIAWFVPLGVGAVWVNLHPSYLLAGFVPLLFAGALLLEGAKERGPVAPFIKFAVLLLIGSLANPYGYKYWFHTFRNAIDPVASTFDLFQSPDLQSPVGLIAPALAVALIVARSLLAPPAGRRADTAILLVFLGAACSARRYTTQLLALQAIILGAMLKSHGARAVRCRVGSLALNTGCSGALLVASWFGLHEHKDPLQHVPSKAAQAVISWALPQNIMNPFHWGGYLAYAWNGNPKYFIDGRDIVGLVANGILDDSGRLRSGSQDWPRILDVYEIKTVLWESGAPLDFYLAHSPAWQLVHRDALAVVFTRRD